MAGKAKKTMTPRGTHSARSHGRKETVAHGRRHLVRILKLKTEKVCDQVPKRGNELERTPESGKGSPDAGKDNDARTHNIGGEHCQDRKQCTLIYSVKKESE